jgi:integrase
VSRPAGPAPGATGQLPVAPGLLERLLAAVRPEFRADELAFGLDDPVFGADRCRAGGCGRAVQARGLCHAHYARWHDNGQPDLDHYVATAGPVNPDRAGSRERQVHLGKLGRQLKLEMQYALQCRRDHSQGKTHPGTARRAVAVLAASGAASILDLSEAEWAEKLPRRGDHARALLISARREVEDLREGGCRWDTEYPRDLWRLRALGVPGQQAAIRFGQIPQPWLKALAKRWARWRVAAGGRSDAVYQGIRAITRFGQFLAASKIPVQGLGQVDRDLIERYLAVLQHELAGRADHPKYIGSLNGFFDAIRRHGWDDTLPATAAIYPQDYPRARTQRLPRAVAGQVMAQVEDPASLALWDNPAYQLVTLILIRCGLRITDAIRLPFGCLVSDSNGAPYLRYLNHKMNREALVPLDDQLVELIRDQQARVQDGYPAGQTVLFPQAQANRDGRKPMHGGAYRRALYSWLARCDIRDERGNPAHITPHQWRHTLGTALINRDVPQHVVQKILDHDSALMTALYARLSEKTVREHWEKARKVGATGQPVQISPDGPLGDAAWAKQQLSRATQALPNGYCQLPLAKTCPHANSCLTCPMFVTTADFLPQHRAQRQATVQLITAAEAAGHTRAAEMNKQVATNLDKIITALETHGEEPEAAADAS